MSKATDALKKTTPRTTAAVPSASKELKNNGSAASVKNTKESMKKSAPAKTADSTSSKNSSADAAAIKAALRPSGYPQPRFRTQMQFIDRELDPGMGRAVARRTYLRQIKNGHTRWETWAEVAERVARGNVSLVKEKSQEHREAEYSLLKKHIANGSVLMSGRHLQHGDSTQPERNMEVFTNCSTASSSYLVFYLLMNGSGVGRPYDDDMCLVNWDNMPNIRVVLSEEHPDFQWGIHESVRDAQHKYGKGEGIHWFEVPDSREGWSQALEMIEIMAYEKKFKDDLLIVDFSKVRPKGSPIHGMQDRPASGPEPIMNAIQHVASIKGADMAAWKQAMYVDHYMAECVLVGGARRSARIATKTWTDPEVFEFIDIKRGGFLWSANNSVAVDDKFWKQDTAHAKKVLKAILQSSYHDGTGEPGFINQHRLVQNDEGFDGYTDGKYAESEKYQPMPRTEKMLAHVARNAASKVYHQIPNPCGEISLNSLGGYCVIGDVVPFFAPTLEDAEEAFRAVTRSLMRVNTMDCLYRREVRRTNRIGVGMTGIHEFAWNAFGYGFQELIDEDRSQDFWQTIARFKRAVVEEAESYAKFLGVNVPHTNTTIKPSGTVSKLFALTEGAHLPSMKEYLRWVQYRSDDPAIQEYQKKGYPTKELKSYKGSTVVGFPTQPMICRLGMGDKLVTAGDASPEDQYKWLMLLEKYWIVGVDEEGQALVDTGNQVSYTLKYKPQVTSFEDYVEMVKKYQGLIKCCSVMPQQDSTAYEYQPEQPINASEFEKISREIEKANREATLLVSSVENNQPAADVAAPAVAAANMGASAPAASILATAQVVSTEADNGEDIDFEQLKCDTGACPI